MSIQPSVALDIGATKVACAIGLPHEHAPGFELLGSSVVAYPVLSDVWLGDPLMVSRTIEQALEATAVSAEFQRALIAINHPLLVSEQARAVVSLGDEPMTVRAQDLDRLHTAAINQVLPIDREALMVERLGCTGNGFDGVRDPRGLSATRLSGTFLILTIPVAARRALIQAVESAGLEVAQVTYTLVAALASTETDELRHKHVLMIDIGGLTTDVGLFVEGVLHRVAVVPWGGIKLAMSIATRLQVTMEQGVAWSLEGMACRKSEVRALIESEWASLQQAIAHLLKNQPRPDAALLSGRGALIDGLAEWVERTAGIPTSFCRSPRASRLGDLSRQVGLSSAIGLLVTATQASNGFTVRSPRLFNRLLDKTRTVLTEYF